MKKSFVVMWALALFVVSIPLSVKAGTPVAPHNNLISCNNCHSDTALGSGYVTAPAPSPAIYNNVCQNCHRPGDGIAGTKPFAANDASIAFGGHSTAANSAMKSQISHRWDGSDTNPAAGALPPIQKAMTSNQQGSQWKPDLRGRTGKQLACVRCHSMHIVPNTNGKLLRMANDQDQMCMDCHRTRNQQSHLSGTHPVNINYANTPGEFNKPMLNANPANPTSDLSAKLTATGNIVCSTCHSTHYADSRSSTVDGAANYANMSTGDGNILRTDLRGAAVNSGSADKLNICTNCHANKKSHNAKGQDIQCADCHGAHVEYDPTNDTNINPQNLPNAYLIRRNVTKAGMASKIYFRYTGSQREYKNAQGTGVCQGCHAVPLGAAYPGHDSNSAKDCNACHFHSNQSGSFSADCTSCHGNPPIANTIGGTTGLASPATGATGGFVGAHEKHAVTLNMACNTCHNGYAERTMANNTIDLGFAVNGANVPGFKGSITTGTYNNTVALNPPYTGFTGPVGSGPNRTCSTVYCHGGTLTPGSVVNPSWVLAPSAQVGCGKCHSITGDALTMGSHKVHAGSTMLLDCTTCHQPVADSSHMNGSVAWDFTAIGGNAQYKPAGTGTVYATAGETNGVAPSNVYGAGYGTCNNISCHGQAKDIPWGGTLHSTTETCAKCHSSITSYNTTGNFYSTAYPQVTSNTESKVGAHVTHLKWLNKTDATACTECHIPVTALKDANHMNGVTNFTTTWSADATRGGLSPSYDPATGRCSNVYCHGAAMPNGDTKGSNRSPKWNEPFLSTVAACGNCHGLPPASHTTVQAPTSFADVAAKCSGCHPETISATPGSTYASVFKDKTIHIDGKVDGGSCNGCHGYPPHTPTFAPKQNQWSSARVEDYAGAGGAHTVAGHVDPKAKPTDGWKNCNTCHTESDHKMAPIAFTPSTNIKVRVDSGLRFANAVQPKYSSNKKDGALHVSGRCSNIACHFQKTPKW